MSLATNIEISKLIDKIIDGVESLKHIRDGDVYGCSQLIVISLDKLEDYLIDLNAYKPEFKYDIRFLRYLMHTIPFKSYVEQNYKIDRAMNCAMNLRKELKKVEYEIY